MARFQTVAWSALIAGWFLAAGTARAADDPYAWVAPPPSLQLYGDDAVIPEGVGAVFVPRMGGEGEEPDVLFVSEGEVLRGPTGTRVLLPPGSYVALVGTGEPSQRVAVELSIEEGRTTMVPVRWGGLRVEAVSRSLRAREGAFELVSLTTGAQIEIPAELRTQGAAQPRTWLLAPGVYRIQEIGLDAVDAPVFSTVYVPEGGLVHFRLFTDRNGTIHGGGVVQADAFLDEEVAPSPWTHTFVVGVDASGTQTRNVAGFPDLMVGQGAAFVDLKLGYTDKRSAVRLGVDAEYGLLLLQPATGEPLPPIKSSDRLAAVLSYTLRLNDAAGVYVRGGVLTQMTPTAAVTTEDSDIAFRELDGSVRTEQVASAKTYRIADAFNPLMFDAGTGLEVRLATTRALDLSLHGGVGFRAWRFENTYVPTDNPSTDAIEYTAIAAFNRPVIEAGIDAQVRLTGFASYTTSLDAFTAFDGAGGIAAVWDNTLSVRITRAVSLNYSLHASRIPWIVDRIALRQGAYLRFALNIL